MRSTLLQTLRLALLIVLLPVSQLSGLVQEPAQSQSAGWWKEKIQQRLLEAGDHQPELIRALQDVRYEHRQALQFLLTNMPESDLRSLKSEFLLENIELAYAAINQVPWGKSIPEEIFFNDILPYANVDETRENWRREMMDRCLPIVRDCQTASEAAQKLNEELFPLIQVRYATSREKANQSPAESMRQSVASCTGLSILLSDACRSVGVPARLAGTPSWTNKRGNHTWVEIWDGQWHFTGAAEPSAEGLNHAWFQNDASQADDSKPMNRIYAVSFAETGMYFPMVWAPRSRHVHGVNVTARYTRDFQELDSGMVRVLIGFRDADGNRVERDVRVQRSDGSGKVLTGRTRGESADTNDLLTLTLPENSTFHLVWLEAGEERRVEKQTGSGEQSWWEVRLDAGPDSFPR